MRSQVLAHRIPYIELITRISLKPLCSHANKMPCFTRLRILFESACNKAHTTIYSGVTSLRHAQTPNHNPQLPKHRTPELQGLNPEILDLKARTPEPRTLQPEAGRTSHCSLRPSPGLARDDFHSGRPLRVLLHQWRIK